MSKEDYLKRQPWRASQSREPFCIPSLLPRPPACQPASLLACLRLSPAQPSPALPSPAPLSSVQLRDAQPRGSGPSASQRIPTQPSAAQPPPA
ncbi:vegetative cell wall protein gp1-like [Dromiciops gliroides]|uniref:vegetative cell wall protein gp1-like n=1 Tax=Dromiciops gliroides TaxID=33562 RepID=UPI001CC359F4|nr:vegetative cell wall protein gp1-like [Dromiciops gliroides]